MGKCKKLSHFLTFGIFTGYLYKENKLWQKIDFQIKGQRIGILL